MTERAAAKNSQILSRQRDRIETLAISVCRIQRLPDPDQETLEAVMSKAMKILTASDGSETEALPEPVFALVAASFV